MLILLFSDKVISDSLWPHRLQHARLLCPPLSPGVCLSSCPLSWCRHPITSSSASPFSFCLRYLYIFFAHTHMYTYIYIYIHTPYTYILYIYVFIIIYIKKGGERAREYYFSGQISGVCHSPLVLTKWDGSFIMYSFITISWSICLEHSMTGKPCDQV